MGVFWSEGAYNKSNFQFQIVMYLQAVINISFQVVLTRFTFVFKLLFTWLYKLLHVVSTSCYNVLKVHVSTRSEMTYQHVRKWRSPPQRHHKKGVKSRITYNWRRQSRLYVILPMPFLGQQNEIIAYSLEGCFVQQFQLSFSQLYEPKC